MPSFFLARLAARDKAQTDFGVKSTGTNMEYIKPGDIAAKNY
jgi:hypothetical protein